MRGIVLQEHDEGIRKQAKRLGLAVEVRPGWETPFDRTLFITPGAKVPWDLVPVGFEFLDKWSAAAPIWSYETLAVDLAEGEERKRTEDLVRDLRVPLYAHEMLFVRDTEGGLALLEAWREEALTQEALTPALSRASGLAQERERLAFLRALYRVKPRFLALPRSWLAQPRVRTRRAVRRPVSSQSFGEPRAPRIPGQALVKVEIGPGRFVKCEPGREDEVREEWRVRRMTRRERRLGNG